MYKLHGKPNLGNQFNYYEYILLCLQTSVRVSKKRRKVYNAWVKAKIINDRVHKASIPQKHEESNPTSKTKFAKCTLS